MNTLNKTKQAYSQILKLMSKHKEICDLDIEAVERKSKIHILGLELKELYGLNIDPKRVNSNDWIDCGEHMKIGLFGERYRRTISWSDDGTQPEDERCVCLKFIGGAFIFGGGGFTNKDYPTKFFHKFWLELLSFNPDYKDTANHCLYWKLENSKEIFNSFNDILKKYYSLNKEDIKQRRIEKMKSDLAELESSKS